MAQCDCFKYRENKSLYADAVKEGKLELISKSDEDYEEKALLRCTLCNKKWKFSRNDSYHYVIVNWDSA